jgi:hypothetical protein
MKFIIQHVIYVVKQLVLPKMFTNESLFTIHWLLCQDSTVHTKVKPVSLFLLL